MGSLLVLASLSKLLPVLLIAVAVIGVMAAATRPRTVFEIVIKDGVADIISGAPPEGFFRDVQRICKLWEGRSGRIRGIEVGTRVDLAFKGEHVRRHSRALLNAWRHPM